MTGQEYGMLVEGDKGTLTFQGIKNWLEICNSELIDEVIHKNSIGAMFLAKVHGFREDNAANVNITVNAPQISESQLNSIAKSELPMLPNAEN